nr:LuxR C-terminal-related transcriptional regulator [Kibdelosporangium aridum]
MIASALFLSRRTVEQHVANILRKMGVSSRQDLIS